jgi:molybdopterin-guanine dinucleotide biosynthesis protein A
MSAVPAVYGLVLAGGRSLRMQRDKAALAYHGRSQLEHAFALLASVTTHCFVSLRAAQRDEPLRARFPQIVDGSLGAGPLAGILAAQQAHPDVAWLILACDLPFLSADTLTELLAHREPNSLATAFRSSHDSLPEPLCAIYEPASAPLLRGFAEAGKSCPRKFLLTHTVTLLEPVDHRALDNVNSSTEYWQAMHSIHPELGAVSRSVTVQYFALLREQAGCSVETVQTAARTPAELYAELCTRHAFTLPPEMLRVAVNACFGEWQQPLADQDTVVFIPPVAGG